MKEGGEVKGEEGTEGEEVEVDVIVRRKCSGEIPCLWGRLKGRWEFCKGVPLDNSGTEVRDGFFWCKKCGGFWERVLKRRLKDTKRYSSEEEKGRTH